jgi:ribosomal protein L7/L12
MIIPQETQQQIELLLSQNKKIQAVALVKEATNCSLKEAKDYVDQLDLPKIPFKGNIDDQLRALLIQGNKIQAIKIYRDHTGASLADSKNYVESLEQYGTTNSSIDKLLQDQPKPKPNYTWMIILLIAAAIIAWALLRK